MFTDRTRLAVSGDLSTNGVRTDLGAVTTDARFHPQKPYRNGIVVYAKSVWGGNGFGNDIARVAVRDGKVVAVYESALTHQIARVAGQGDIISDGQFYGHGANRRWFVTTTALNKWIARVKGL